MWMLYAIGSSFFAGITAILAKCGIKKTDSDVGTAIRTILADGIDYRNRRTDYADQR